MSAIGPERQFAAPQRHSRYLGSCGHASSGFDPTPNPPFDAKLGAKCWNRKLIVHFAVSASCSLRFYVGLADDAAVVVILLAQKRSELRTAHADRKHPLRE